MTSNETSAPVLKTGDFAISYNKKHDRISLLSDDGDFAVEVETGSKAELRFRRTLVRNGVIEPVALTLFNDIELVDAPNRSIDAALVNDDRPIASAVNINFFKNLFIPHQDDVRYWLVTQNVADEILDEVMNLMSTLSNKQRYADATDDNIKRFVEILLWENSYFESDIGLACFDGRNQSKLISGSTVRDGKPVTMLDLCFITHVFRDEMDWSNVTVAELAFALGRNKSLFNYVKSTGNSGNKSSTKSDAAMRFVTLKQFRAVTNNNSAFAWMLLSNKAGEDAGQARAKLVDRVRRDAERRLARDAVRGACKMVAKEFGFDHAEAIFNQKHTYFTAGIIFPDYIINGVRADLDVDILLAIHGTELPS